MRKLFLKEFLMKQIRILKTLNESNLLFISSNSSITSNILNQISDSFKQPFIAHEISQALEILKNQKIDIVILDSKIQQINFRSCCFGLDKKFSNTPKIILCDDFNDDFLTDALNFGSFIVFKTNIDPENLKLAITFSMNNSKCCSKLVFVDGIYYDEKKEQFFRKDNSPIELTKLELNFMQLMIEKRGEIVDYSTIKETVWKDKKMSVYTMRNIISKLRIKIHPDIVTNHSNKGYSLDTPKICS